MTNDDNSDIQICIGNLLSNRTNDAMKLERNRILQCYNIYSKFKENVLMKTPTKSTTIRFDENVLKLIHKQAALEGQTPTEFMREAVLEKLEDSLDYRDAVENIRRSKGETVSRDDVKKQLGM